MGPSGSASPWGHSRASDVSPSARTPGRGAGWRLRACALPRASRGPRWPCAVFPIRWSRGHLAGRSGGFTERDGGMSGSPRCPWDHIYLRGMGLLARGVASGLGPDLRLCPVTDFYPPSTPGFVSSLRLSTGPLPRQNHLGSPAWGSALPCPVLGRLPSPCQQSPPSSSFPKPCRPAQRAPPCSVLTPQLGTVPPSLRPPLLSAYRCSAGLPR